MLPKPQPAGVLPILTLLGILAQRPRPPRHFLLPLTWHSWVIPMYPVNKSDMSLVALDLYVCIEVSMWV